MVDYDYDNDNRFADNEKNSEDTTKAKGRADAIRPYQKWHLPDEILCTKNR